jgi:rhamnose utilization protein RhaD (predicted bifunctional aldolase and dehydrogenase)
MITAAYSIEKQVKAFCAQIGVDPLLVQGAGGNVSWKDGGVLWVKASGMWLAEAESNEIFVPVNLTHLQDALAKQDFSVKPEIVSSSGLRPSIETLLHALMPHRVVVHLHAVEVLAHLVRVNARQKIQDLVGDAVNWIFVDYVKPGADLAKVIAEELKGRPNAEVIFMASHGVVVGGANIDDIAATMHTLNLKLQSKTSTLEPKISKATRKSDFLTRGYMPCSDREVNQLAVKYELIGRLRNEWALYPDHVVFLGPEATILERNFTILELDDVLYNKPPFIFAVGEGVYESLSVSPGQKSQLRCYYDVVSRLGGEEMLSTFSKLMVSELISWDAEKFRKNAQRKKSIILIGN